MMEKTEHLPEKPGLDPGFRKASDEQIVAGIRSEHAGIDQIAGRCFCLGREGWDTKMQVEVWSDMSGRASNQRDATAIAPRLIRCNFETLGERLKGEFRGSVGIGHSDLGSSAGPVREP
jgi:hypothetical protein